MNTSRMSRRLLIALAIMLASLSALATAQVPPLITACVKAKGTIRIIATGEKCTATRAPHHMAGKAHGRGVLLPAVCDGETAQYPHDRRGGV